MLYENTHDPNQKHPMETIEPIEDDDDDSRVEVIGKLFGLIFPPCTRTTPDTIEAGWIRFICLVMIVKPELLQGATQTFIAKLMGCTPSNVSKYSNEVADKIGIRGEAMKSNHARSSYSIAQLKRAKESKSAAGAMEIHDNAVLMACKSARSKLTTGKAWSKFERASLCECGLLDKDERMTEEGKEFFQEGVASGR